MSYRNEVLAENALEKVSKLGPLRKQEFIGAFSALGDTAESIINSADNDKLIEINMWLGTAVFKSKSDLSPAIELVTIERYEQINKHGRTVRFDVVNNAEGQLSDAASFLTSYGNDNPYGDEEFLENIPDGWNSEWWLKVCKKDYGDRCVISAALLIAEVDRLMFEEDCDTNTVDDEQD